MKSRLSATMVLRTVLAPAILALEPTARNSNLLPVKANGLVRLRSPASLGSLGRIETPVSKRPPCLLDLGGAFFDLLEDVGELIAEEDGDDRRRGFVGAEAMIVVGAGDGEAKDFAVLADSADDGGAEDEELRVFVRGVAGVEEVFAGVGGHRPVVVLTGAVDAGKGFFVEEADEAVLVGDAAHDLHDHVLVIGGEVAVFEERGEFVLAGGDFVVAGFDGDAELDEFVFAVGHEGQDAFGDDAEIVVFQFLALWRRCAEEGAAAGDQVGTGVVEVLVDEEIFLLGADGGEDLVDVGVPKSLRMRMAWVLRASMLLSKRGFLVEGFTGPTEEGGGDDQRGAIGMLHDVGGAGGVPGGVAAGFEGGAQAAGGEAAGVGLALDEFLAAEDRPERRSLRG